MIKKFKLKLILRIIAMCCAGLFVCCNLYLWYSQSIRGNSMPMPFGFGTSIVLSGSMEPALSVDDLIVVVEHNDYQVGDIVVYQSGSSLVVHRIVAIEGDMVTTQGDANNAPDAPVPVRLIKGEVVFRVKYVGSVVRLLKKPAVYFSLVGLAIWMLERSFRKEKQQEDDEIQKLEEEIRRLKQTQEE